MASALGTHGQPADDPLELVALRLLPDLGRYVGLRNGLCDTDIDDLVSMARIRILQHGARALAGFEGRSSLSTYLIVVLQRLAIDQRVAAKGRWRPSAAAVRLGADATKFERLVVSEGVPISEALLELSPSATRSDQAALIRLVEQRTHRPKPHPDPERAIAEQPTEEPDAELRLLTREAHLAFAKALESLRGIIKTLPPQDRLILRLHFDQGVSIADIARTLRSQPRPLYRRVARLISLLRSRLETTGVDNGMLIDALRRNSYLAHSSSVDVFDHKAEATK